MCNFVCTKKCKFKAETPLAYQYLGSGKLLSDNIRFLLLYVCLFCLFDCVSLAAPEVCIKQAGFELTEILCLLRVEMKSMRYHTQLHFRLLNIHTLSSPGEAEAGRA